MQLVFYHNTTLYSGSSLGTVSLCSLNYIFKLAPAKSFNDFYPSYVIPYNPNSEHL